MLNIVSVNDAPIITKGNTTDIDNDTIRLSTPEDTDLDITIIATDVEGDILTLDTTETRLDDGSIIKPATGTSMTYQPIANAVGYDTLKVIVRDPYGGEDIAVLIIQILDYNQPPIQDNPIPQINTVEGTSYTSVNVIQYFSDPDDDLLNVFQSGSSILFDPSALNGTISYNPDSTFTYEPNPGYSGADVISFLICDNNSPDTLCTDARIDVKIEELPDPPVAVNDFYFIEMNIGETLYPFENDSDPDNPDGNLSKHTLEIDISYTKTKGKVSSNSDNSISYTPQFDFTGLDTVYYFIVDPISGVKSRTWITFKVGNKIDQPYVLTPDNDGKNDAFVLDGFDEGDQTLAQLQIFNRWGNIVYESKNYENNWKGQNKRGDMLPSGTYYYIYNFKEGRELKINYIFLAN